VDFGVAFDHTSLSAHGCNPAAPLFFGTRPKQSNLFDGRVAAWDRGKLFRGARRRLLDMQNSLQIPTITHTRRWFPENPNKQNPIKRIACHDARRNEILAESLL
jgi:hypothetical protein